MNNSGKQKEILRNLPKHSKYKKCYRRGDFFWGLGVEHETYIKSSQEKTFNTFVGNMNPERYSVSYYKSYKQEFLPSILEKVIEKENNKLKVPILLNSHTFTNTDKFNIHKTTFEKEPKPNSKAEKYSFFEWACTYSSWLSKEYDKVFTWDGDSIEFMTQNFYKSCVKDVLNELKYSHSKFITELNSLPKQGILVAYSPFTLSFPNNPPFAAYLTNLNNISMFNNGTFHINITLPTRLAFFKKETPYNWSDFEEKHRRLARLIQWFEPLWISVYGSPDPLSSIDSSFASSASQRIAVSRYIGLGTFDTEEMPRGKILQIPKPSLDWYDSLYKKTQYQHLDKIGLDINFNKHGAHGLELRFFDQMSFASLEKVLYDLILLCDLALDYSGPVPDPKTYNVWKEAATQCLLQGKQWKLTKEQMISFSSVLKIPYIPPSISFSPEIALQWFFSQLPRNGFCWKKMVLKN